MLVAALWAAGIAPAWTATASPQAEVVRQGLLECYPSATKDSNGNLVYCEASAVNVRGNEIVVANDKPYQGTSFIRLLLDRQLLAVSDEPPSYLTGGAHSLLSKVEGMTATPDGKWVLATAAFDRVDVDSALLDAYNVLLAWPADKPHQAKVIEPSSHDGITSSMDLRKRLERHLGMPYFKIEGLAMLPGNRLLFGIRELGNNYKDFRYRVLILEVAYAIDGNGEFTLGHAFSTLLDFVPPAELNLPAGLGLTSLEFNPLTKQLFLLTSTEIDGHLGAYLWYMPWDETISDRKTDVGPRPVLGADGRMFHLDNKAEGMAFIDRDTLLVVSDNDRILGGVSGRRPHQAPYDIIKIRQ